MQLAKNALAASLSLGAAVILSGLLSLVDTNWQLAELVTVALPCLLLPQADIATLSANNR
jgi:hypothetical protein